MLGRRVCGKIIWIWRDGEARFNTPVCRTGIHRFESDSRLKVNCSIISFVLVRVVGSAVERVPDRACRSMGI